MRIIVFLTPQSNKSLEKQQRDTLLSNRLEIEWLGIHFAKEPHRPQVTNSPVYIEVINFCGSQPCFPSRKQRYHGLIELKPRTFHSKAFQNSTVALLGGLISFDLLVAVAHKLLDPQLTLPQNGGRGPTSQEITDHPKADNDKQSENILEYSKRKSSRFAFELDSDYSSRQKGDRAMRKLDLQHRTLELKHQWKLLKADDDSNSDDSTLTEVAGERRKKSKAVYEKSTIKPERFPDKDFNRWELWVKHYKSVAKTNGWSDQQAIAALPACLTSWVVEEFETVPRKYIEKLPGEPSPTFSNLLEVLKPKMQQY